MQQPSHQTPVTVSSLLGLMALAIAAGRAKAKAQDGDAGAIACELPARREAGHASRPQTATA